MYIFNIYVYICIYMYIYIVRKSQETKTLILIVSCLYGNLRSSCYTKLINGYRKFTI